MSALLAFPGVTTEQYAALQAAAAAHGFEIAGNYGNVSAEHCTIGYSYLGSTLTLSVLSAPPFCTGKAIHVLHDLVESVIQPPPAAPAEKRSV